MSPGRPTKTSLSKKSTNYWVTKMCAITKNPEDWEDENWRTKKGYWYKLAKTVHKYPTDRDRMWLKYFYDDPLRELQPAFRKRVGAVTGMLHSPVAASTPKPPVEKYCICEGPEDDYMVECTTCLKWFHCICLSVDFKKVSKDPKFQCCICLDNPRINFPSLWLRRKPVERVSRGEISTIHEATMMDPKAVVTIDAHGADEEVFRNPKETAEQEVTHDPTDRTADDFISIYPSDCDDDEDDFAEYDDIDFNWDNVDQNYKQFEFNGINDKENLNKSKDKPVENKEEKTNDSSLTSDLSDEENEGNNNTKLDSDVGFNSDTASDDSAPVENNKEKNNDSNINSDLSDEENEGNNNNPKLDSDVGSNSDTGSTDSALNASLNPCPPNPNITKAPPKNFTFEVDFKEWLTYVETSDGQQKLRKGWTDLIYNYFEKDNPYCVLVFGKSTKTSFNPTSRTNYLYTGGSCKHKGCWKFFITCRQFNENRNLKFEARCVGTFYHHPDDTHSRRIQYNNRNKIKNKLKHRNCGAVATEIHKYSNMDGVRGGNDTTRPERKLFKNMKYEKMKENDKHENPFADLHEQKIQETKEGDEYLRRISIFPFHVVYFSTAQLRIYQLLQEYNIPIVLHSDGTGGLTQDIPDIGGSTKSLMYAIVVAHPFPSFPPLALCEFITNNHTAASIATCLNVFINGFKSKTPNSKKFVQRVETDFSQAMIYAVLDAFLGMKINDYLNHCFKELIGTKTPLDVNLHVCRSHMMHTFTEQIKAHFGKNFDGQEDIKRLLQQYCKSTTFAESVYFIRKIFVLCLTEFQTEPLLSALNSIDHLPSIGDLDDHLSGMNEVVIESGNAKSTDALYSSTCFGIYFINMKEEICNENSATNCKGLKRNHWCNEEFVQYLLLFILPHTPLVTHIMFDIRQDIDWFDHQWPAEFWNRIVKIEEQGKNGKTKLSRYIAASKDMIKGRCNDFEANLRKQSGISKKQLRGEVKLPNMGKVQTGRVDKKDQRTPRRNAAKTPKKLQPSASVMDPLSNDVQEGWCKRGRQVARPNMLGNEFDNLPFILWSRRAKDKPGFTLTNSCPLDNGLMILTYAYTTFSGIRNFFTNSNVPNQHLQREIVEVINHIRSRRFNEGKHRWMLNVMQDKKYTDAVLDAEQQFGGGEVNFNMWGCEWSYVVTPLAEYYTLFEEVTSCEVHYDVRRPFTVTELVESSVTKIISTINGETAVLEKCREDGCYHQVKSRRVQYQEQIGPVPLVLLTPLVANINTTVGTSLVDVPATANMFGKVYKLLGVSMLVRSLAHYISVFPVAGGKWVIYNGMRPNNQFEVVQSVPYNDKVSTVWYRLSSC